MKLQNMKRGETTEQITLFNWAENNKHICRAFPSCITFQTRERGQTEQY